MTNTSLLTAPAWLDHSALLNPDPLFLEMGVQQEPDGSLSVACRTELHGCKGRMLDWWFTFFETTEHIRWWHPIDHVEHRGWDGAWKKGESFYGASIHAVESLADIPPVAARLKFHDPADIFDEAVLAHARARGDVSAIIAARIGFGDDVVLDRFGDPIGGEMLHVVRDTPTGAVLRSKFVLGRPVEGVEAAPIDPVIGLNLMKHCYSEFTFLSRVLPSLYYAENSGKEAVPMPW